MVAAEGVDDRVIRAAVQFKNAGYGEPVLIGREDEMRRTMEKLGFSNASLEVHNARLSERNQTYADFLYNRLPRARLSAPSESGPQCLWRVHGGERRCRRHDYRRQPGL